MRVQKPLKTLLNSMSKSTSEGDLHEIGRLDNIAAAEEVKSNGSDNLVSLPTVEKLVPMPGMGRRVTIDPEVGVVVVGGGESGRGRVTRDPGENADEEGEVEKKPFLRRLWRYLRSAWTGVITRSGKCYVVYLQGLSTKVPVETGV